MRRWQVQDAKARFSDLLRESLRSGPQEITVRGRATAVVLSRADYDRLSKPKVPLVKFLRSSPLNGVELKIERDPSPGRDVDL